MKKWVFKVCVGAPNESLAKRWAIHVPVRLYKISQRTAAMVLRMEQEWSSSARKCWLSGLTRMERP